MILFFSDVINITAFTYLIEFGLTPSFTASYFLYRMYNGTHTHTHPLDIALCRSDICYQAAVKKKLLLSVYGKKWRNCCFLRITLSLFPTCFTVNRTPSDGKFNMLHYCVILGRPSVARAQFPHNVHFSDSLAYSGFRSPLGDSMSNVLRCYAGNKQRHTTQPPHHP